VPSPAGTRHYSPSECQELPNRPSGFTYQKTRIFKLCVEQVFKTHIALRTTLGYYVVNGDNSLPTFRDKRPPNVSKVLLLLTAEECSSHLHCGQSPKSDT